MPRKKTDTVDYIPMYSVPSRTCQMLEKKFGTGGYAFFYKLLQLLALEDMYIYDARDPMDLDYLYQLLDVEGASVEDILNTMAEWGKIDKELWGQKIIWYQGFVDSLEPVYQKRNRDLPTKKIACESKGISVDFCFGNDEVKGISVPEIDAVDAFLEQKCTEMSQSKVKERKGKERKETHYVCDKDVGFDKSKFFLEWYNLYPKKGTKSKASHKFNSNISSMDLYNDLIRATKNYLELKKGMEQRYLKSPENFLDEWHDYIDNSNQQTIIGISQEDQKLLRENLEKAYDAYFDGFKGDIDDCFDAMIRNVKPSEIDKFSKAFNKYTEFSEVYLEEGNARFIKPFRKFILDWKDFL